MELLKGLVVQVTGVEVMVMDWPFLVFSLYKGSMQQIEVHCSGNSEGGQRALPSLSISARAVQGWLPRGMHLVLRMTASGSGVWVTQDGVPLRGESSGEAEET